MSSQVISTENSSFEKILRSAMELPGIKINRVEFLEKELSKYFDSDTVSKAISTNPAQAGLTPSDIERIANACITYETAKVTAISAGAGLAGGIAMAVTIPADTAQLFGHVLRILQKLAYLYGWPEIFRGENKSLDDETNNQIILFIGAMFGVGAANTAISKIATLAALNVPKRLMRQALTKKAIYQIVKKISFAVGAKMTKAAFTKTVGKIIPVIGAAASAGITFAIFKPMAKRLKNYLAILPTADIEFYRNSQNTIDVIDIDFNDECE